MFTRSMAKGSFSGEKPIVQTYSQRLERLRYKGPLSHQFLALQGITSYDSAESMKLYKRRFPTLIFNDGYKFTFCEYCGFIFETILCQTETKFKEDHARGSKCPFVSATEMRIMSTPKTITMGGILRTDPDMIDRVRTYGNDNEHMFSYRLAEAGFICDSKCFVTHRVTVECQFCQLRLTGKWNPETEDPILEHLVHKKRRCDQLTKLIKIKQHFTDAYDEDKIIAYMGRCCRKDVAY